LTKYLGTCSIKEIVMDKKEDNVCKDDCLSKTPELIKIITVNGIEITGNIFLLSPNQGCCAQTLLPFWAKVIGRIKNCTTKEIFIRININLFDGNENMVGRCSDIIILDAGQKGEFDVKLTGHNKNISKYSIEAEAVGEFI
jgi:hypothetical protein